MGEYFRELLKQVPEDLKKKIDKSFEIAVDFDQHLDLTEDDYWNLEEACDRYVDRTMEGPNIALSNK